MVSFQVQWDDLKYLLIVNCTMLNVSSIDKTPFCKLINNKRQDLSNI
jgi:hypothetical protein